MPNVTKAQHHLFQEVKFFSVSMEVSEEIIRSLEFRQVYAIGAIIGHSPYDFRIAFYNDSSKPLIKREKHEITMERKIETKIILSPLAAKEMASWLNSHIQDYERLFGEIKKPGTQASNVQPSEAIHVTGYI